MVKSSKHPRKKWAELTEQILTRPDDKALLINKLKLAPIYSKTSSQAAEEARVFFNSITSDLKNDLGVFSAIVCYAVESDDQKLFRSELEFAAKSFPETKNRTFLKELHSRLNKHISHRAFLKILINESWYEEVSTKQSASEEVAIDALKSAIEKEQLVKALQLFTEMAVMNKNQHRLAYALAQLLYKSDKLRDANDVLDYAINCQNRNQNYLKLKSEILFKLDQESWHDFYVSLKQKVDLTPEMREQILKRSLPEVKEGDASPIYIPVSTDVEYAFSNHEAPIKSSNAPEQSAINNSPPSRKELFRRELLELDVASYKPIIKSYIKESQFKAKWKIADKESIELIENKLAIDLKYLDMKIREIVLPYLIKIEVYIRHLYRHIINYNDSNSEILRKISGIIGDEFTVVLDDTKVQGIDSMKLSRRDFRNILILIYLQIRNFLMHGNKNFFDFYLSRNFQRKLDRPISMVSEQDDVFWKQIGDVEEVDFDSVKSDIQSYASESAILNEFFEMKILSDIMTPEARRKQRILGVLILLLYLSNDSTFINLATMIDKCILDFFATTQFGSRDNLYEALGLRSNWLVTMIALHLKK